MIEANELRIGNIVWGIKATNVLNGTMIISSKHIYDLENDKSEFEFYGLEVTEKRLLMFGAKLNKGNVVVGFDLDDEKQDTYWYEWEGFTIVQWGLNTPYFYINHKTKIEIKSIHQLQNLYFALTQTELEIK